MPSDDQRPPKRGATSKLVRPDQVSVRTSAPEIRIGLGSAGRETLEAITNELFPDVEDPTTPMRKSTRGSGPEISVAEGPLGRETLSAITDELASEEGPLQLAVFEMLTFIVQHPGAASLSAETSRRGFVERYLLHRLPEPSMRCVERIDVTPGPSPDTLNLRIWCRL